MEYSLCQRRRRNPSARSYFPFSASLERWINSFKRLHIGFNGAEMQLDLLVRKGKYENGFMHGPVPPFFSRRVDPGAD